MKKLFLMGTALCVLGSTMAAHAGDTDMTCEEITAEMAQLNDIVTAAGDADVTNTVTQAGTSAAVHGALWSGAGSSIPFLGGVANAVGAVTSANAENAKKKAEEAEKRMIKLQTISEMKSCS